VLLVFEVNLFSHEREHVLKGMAMICLEFVFDMVVQMDGTANGSVH